MKTFEKEQLKTGHKFIIINKCYVKRDKNTGQFMSVKNTIQRSYKRKIIYLINNRM